MKRTQIYIPEKLHKKAKNLAKKQKRSMSDLFRQYIERGLKSNKPRKDNSLSDLASLEITGGPEDLSENMDKYIYGE